MVYISEQSYGELTKPTTYSLGFDRSVLTGYQPPSTPQSFEGRPTQPQQYQTPLTEPQYETDQSGNRYINGLWTDKSGNTWDPNTNTWSNGYSSAPQLPQLPAQNGGFTGLSVPPTQPQNYNLGFNTSAFNGYRPQSFEGRPTQPQQFNTPLTIQNPQRYEDINTAYLTPEQTQNIIQTADAANPTGLSSAASRIGGALSTSLLPESVTGNLPDQWYFPVKQVVEGATSPLGLATLPLGGEGIDVNIGKNLLGLAGGAIASGAADEYLPDSTPYRGLAVAGAGLAGGIAGYEAPTIARAAGGGLSRIGRGIESLDTRINEPVPGTGGPLTAGMTDKPGLLSKAATALSDETGGGIIPGREQVINAGKVAAPYAVRSAIGAGVGASTAAATGNDPLTGAAIGAAGGLAFAFGAKGAEALANRGLGEAAITAAEKRPSAASKLMELVKAAKPVREEQQALYHEELSRRAGKLAGALASGSGESAYGKGLATLKGELPRATFEPPRPSLTTDDIASLFNHVRDTPSQPFQKLNTMGALTKLLAGELPTRSEISLLGKAFGDDFAQSILAKRKLGARVMEGALDALNLPRTLVTAWDASAPLRQGAILSAGHPIAALKSAGTMIRAMASPRFADAVDTAIQESPNAHLYERMKLYFAPHNSSSVLNTREEAFMSRLAQKIPGVAGSQRGYTTFLNKLRQDVADSFIAGNPKLSDQEWEQFGHWINVATGRGDIPKQLGDAAALSNALFAPRYAMSRIQVPIEAIRGIGASNPVRKEIARDVVAFVGAGTSLLAAGQLAGVWKVELDPRSTDFGKGKMGPTRFDFWAGEQQMARYVAQFTTGQRKDSTGRIQSAGRQSIIGRWLQSKESPAVGLVQDISSGETFTGEKLGLNARSVGLEAYQHSIPLFIQDITDAINEGVSGFRAAPSAFGGGVQTYQDSGYKQRDTFTQQNYGGRHYEDLSPLERQAVDRDFGKVPTTNPDALSSQQASATLREGNVARQTEIDKQGPGQQWRDEYHLLQQRIAGQYEDNRTRNPYDSKYGSPMDKAMGEWSATIDANTKGVTTDWDAVDAWMTQNPDKAALVNEYMSGKQNTDLTPMVTEYKAASKTLGDSGLFDIKDQAWSQIATNTGMSGFPTEQDFEQSIDDQIRPQLVAQNIPTALQDQIISTAIGKNPIVKAYGNLSTGLRLQWAAADPKRAALALKWGYISPSKAINGIVASGQQ